eukprot:7387845-Prymnesium_polylepis.1
MEGEGCARIPRARLRHVKRLVTTPAVLAAGPGARGPPDNSPTEHFVDVGSFGTSLYIGAADRCDTYADTPGTRLSETSFA